MSMGYKTKEQSEAVEKHLCRVYKKPLCRHVCLGKDRTILTAEAC